MNDRDTMSATGGADHSGRKTARAPARRSTIIDDADRKLIIHCSRPAGANRWVSSAK